MLNGKRQKAPLKNVKGPMSKGKRPNGKRTKSLRPNLQRNVTRKRMTRERVTEMMPAMIPALYSRECGRLMNWLLMSQPGLT